MPVMIKLTGTNGDVWINGSNIQHMIHRDGETAVFLTGSSVAIFVKEQPEEIDDKIGSAIEYIWYLKEREG